MTVRRTLTILVVMMLAVSVTGQLAKTTEVESQAGQEDGTSADLSQQQLPEGFPEDLPEGFPEEVEGFFNQGDEATTAASTTISALGSVAAAAEVSLSFQMSGTVDGVYVQTGDYVQEGEVLADLDATDAWESYNQALLNLESAQISMDDLLEPPTESELEVAQANIISAQAAYGETANPMSDEELQAAQMQYDLQVQQLEALVVQRAYTGGSAEQTALMDAQVGAATFNTEISRLQLEAQTTPNSTSLWSASLRVQQAQLEMEQLLAGPEQSEIDSAQLTIDRAQTTVLDAQNTLVKTQLVAPRSGYVMAVNIESGQSITPQEVVIEIADLSQLQMTVPVNELDIGLIEDGMSAAIELDALPGVEILGTVEDSGWLSATSSDGIVTYDVRIVLETTDSRVLSGMTGEVTIETGSEAA